MFSCTAQKLSIWASIEPDPSVVICSRPLINIFMHKRTDEGGRGLVGSLCLPVTALVGLSRPGAYPLATAAAAAVDNNCQLAAVNNLSSTPALCGRFARYLYSARATICTGADEGAATMGVPGALRAGERRTGQHKISIMKCALRLPICRVYM